MQRRFRLAGSSDFQRVRRFGKSYAHPLIVLVALPSERAANSHFGVAAGRTIGNAVQRNRARRQIRAALQPFLPEIQPGWDIILIARRPLAQASYQQLVAALETLLHKVGLIRESVDEQEASSQKNIGPA